MVEKIVLPTNDLAFKKLFANNSYKEILKGLIEDFYNITLKDIFIENPYSITEFNSALDKEGYFAVEVDSFCTAENNWKFSIEMQLHPQHYYPERSLKYLCDKYISTYGVPGLMRGRSKYSSLYPVFSINILGYNYFSLDKKAIRRFNLFDVENHNHFHNPDLFTLGFFELQKPDLGENKNLKYWQELFISGKANHNAPKYIQNAADLLKISSFSKEEREMIDLLERVKEDKIAQEEYVFDKGKLEGEIETVINFINELKLSVSTAMQISGMKDNLRDELITQLNKRNIPYTL